MSLFLALQSATYQGVLWGIMAVGVYITFRLLDIADMTCDGSFATGSAVLQIMVIQSLRFLPPLLRVL